MNDRVRNQTIVILILLLVVLIFTGCGKVEYRERIEPIKGENGIDGKDGQDGKDGKDGESSIISIVDPCGDGPGADEVLLIMDDGSVLAWYKDLGLSVLTEGVTYYTTDQQACRFKIENSQVVEL